MVGKDGCRGCKNKAMGAMIAVVGGDTSGSGSNSLCFLGRWQQKLWWQQC